MKKHKKIKFITSLAITGLVIFSIVILLNRDNLAKISKGKSKNADQTLLSYKIYNNDDNNNIQLLVTIDSEAGIEYIKQPNGLTIYGYGKNKIAIDYKYHLGQEDIFEIKETNKKVSNEKISISETGNEEAPLIIMNAEQLANIQHFADEKLKDNISKDKIYYRLGANIDLNEIEWTPIGSKNDPFIGTLDGGGYTISNLKYENAEEDNVGLFKYVSGTLKNIKLENAVVTGKDNVGGLVGYSTGTLDSNTVNAKVTGNDSIGGLVGYSTGSLIGNSIETTINGVSNVGGIVGTAKNKVNYNTTNGIVIATGDNLGGIVGNGDEIKEITNNTSNIKVEGMNNVGGLIGSYNRTTWQGSPMIDIESNEVNGDINGISCVGGMIGRAYKIYSQITLQSNKNKGNINGTIYIGGIIGYLQIGNGNNNITTYGYIQNCYSIGNITAIENYAGGIIGYQVVIGGGQKGYGYFYLENCYSTGKITVTEGYAGGLIGKTRTIGTGSSAAGIGRTYINNCFSTSNINGKSNIGGIAGEIERYARTNGPGYSYIDITNVYATGKTEGESNTEPLIGSYTETVTNGKKGKFTITGTYWVPETTGLLTSTYGTMKNLSDMFYASQFPTFDFSTIWKIDEGNSMPYLINLDKPDTVNK